MRKRSGREWEWERVGVGESGSEWERVGVGEILADLNLLLK